MRFAMRHPIAAVRAAVYNWKAERGWAGKRWFAVHLPTMVLTEDGEAFVYSETTDGGFVIHLPVDE